MRSLASIGFGITFTIVLMLLAAFNRRQPAAVAEAKQPPKQPPRRSSRRPGTPQVAAYYDAIGVSGIWETVPQRRPVEPPPLQSISK